MTLSPLKKLHKAITKRNVNDSGLPVPNIIKTRTILTWLTWSKVRSLPTDCLYLGAHPLLTPPISTFPHSRLSRPGHMVYCVHITHSLTHSLESRLSLHRPIFWWLFLEHHFYTFVSFRVILLTPFVQGVGRFPCLLLICQYPVFDSSCCIGIFLLCWLMNYFQPYSNLCLWI